LQDKPLCNIILRPSARTNSCKPHWNDKARMNIITWWHNKWELGLLVNSSLVGNCLFNNQVLIFPMPVMSAKSFLYRTRQLCSLQDTMRLIRQWHMCTQRSPCNFWATICKTVCPMLLNCCLSVTLVVLWPNGWMDQNETWHGGTPWPRPHCVRWEPSSSPKKRHRPQFLAHVRCGQTTGWIKIPLGREVGLGPGDFVLDGDPASPQKRGHRPPNFRPMPVVMGVDPWVDRGTCPPYFLKWRGRPVFCPPYLGLTDVFHSM